MIYLSHPLHGTKVAYTDVEANEDRKHGWVPFDEVQSIPLSSEVHEVQENTGTACPKCGRLFHRGLTMHVKHCKAQAN
jgi:DNA-directed RNA polymerase subunit RPC12/RpoP